jgi:hypothetical protein
MKVYGCLVELEFMIGGNIISKLEPHANEYFQSFHATKISPTLNPLKEVAQAVV